MGRWMREVLVAGLVVWGGVRGAMPLTDLVSAVKQARQIANSCSVRCAGSSLPSDEPATFDRGAPYRMDTRYVDVGSAVHILLPLDM